MRIKTIGIVLISAMALFTAFYWVTDPARREKAGVPESVVFQTKTEIALDQIRAAAAAEMPRGVVLMDAGYGADTRQPSARRLAFPPVIDPAALPIRPERHVPNSIATVRRRLTTALARSLKRCPCCLRRATHRSTNLVTQ